MDHYFRLMFPKVVQIINVSCNFRARNSLVWVPVGYTRHLLAFVELMELPPKSERKIENIVFLSEFPSTCLEVFMTPDRWQCRRLACCSIHYPVPFLFLSFFFLFLFLAEGNRVESKHWRILEEMVGVLAVIGHRATWDRVDVRAESGTPRRSHTKKIRGQQWDLVDEASSVRVGEGVISERLSWFIRQRKPKLVSISPAFFYLLVSFCFSYWFLPAVLVLLPTRGFCFRVTLSHGMSHISYVAADAPWNVLLCSFGFRAGVKQCCSTLW